MVWLNDTVEKTCECGRVFTGSAHGNSTPLCKPCRRIRDNAQRRRERALAKGKAVKLRLVGVRGAEFKTVALIFSNGKELFVNREQVLALIGRDALAKLGGK